MKKKEMRIKALIVWKYGTSSDFAPVVGMSESIVSRILNCRRQLTETELYRWEKALGCKREDLV